MTKRLVWVNQLIEVETDDEKFDAAFMDGFCESFYPYDTMEEHACHLAQMYARGVLDNGDFIEGYGPPAKMGIKFNWIDQEENIENDSP